MSCLEYRDYCQNFKTVSKLGNGNCASVVKVQHIKSKKQYALKYSKLDSMDKLVTAFQQIEVANALKHPTAIEIYYYFVKSAHQNLGQFGTQKFQFGIIMEMADRSFQQDIQLRKKKNQHYKQQQIQQIAHQLITFFCHAQRKDYLHRDIKPANILIMPECPATSNLNLNLNLNLRSKYRVCDFGFAIKNHQFSSKNIAGTACYASPKIQNKFRNNQLYIMGNNFKDDVYSLGITLLQLCTLQSAQDVQPGRLLLKVNTLYGLKFSNMLQSMLKFQQQRRPDFIQLSEHCQKYFIAYKTYSLSNIALNTLKNQQKNDKSSDIANLNKSYFLAWNQKTQEQVEICRNQNKSVVQQQQKIQFEPRTAQSLYFDSSIKIQNQEEQQARLSICRNEGKDKNLGQLQQKEAAIAKTDRKKQQDMTLKYKQKNQNNANNSQFKTDLQNGIVESRLNDKKQRRYQLKQKEWRQSRENTDKIKTKRRSKLINNQAEQMSKHNNILQSIAKAYNKYIQKQGSRQQKQRPYRQQMSTVSKGESVGSNMRLILNMSRVIGSSRSQQQSNEQCSSQAVQSQFSHSQQSQKMHNIGITCAVYIPAISISESGDNNIIISRNNSESCSMILMGGMNILHMYCEWHGSKNSSSMTIILNEQFIIQHIQHINGTISCMCSNNKKINMSIAPRSPIMCQLELGKKQSIHMQFRQCQLPLSAITVVPCPLELIDCKGNRRTQIMMGLMAQNKYMRIQFMQQYVYTLQFKGVINKYKQKSSQQHIMVGMFQTHITIIASHFHRIYQPNWPLKNSTNASYKLQIWVMLATGSYLVLDQNLKLIRSCQISPNCLNACNFYPSCQDMAQLQPNIHKDNMDRLISKYEKYNQNTKSVSFLTIDCYGNVFNQKGSLVFKTQIKNAIWVCWKDSQNKLDASGKQLMVITQNGMVYTTKQAIKQDRQSCQIEANPTIKVDKHRQSTQNNGKYTNKYIQIVQNIRRNSYSGTDNNNKNKIFLSLQHKPNQEQAFPQ